ncbi:hypothetical protein ACFQ0B_53125 [Nonomuraea thailandensis]
MTLGVRPIEGTHTLGREVFLVPVDWTAHGPVFAPETGGVRLTERLPGLAPASVQREDPAPPERTRFGGGRLGLEWSSLRGPVTGLVEPTADGLEIAVAPEPLGSTGVPAFVARRQQHVRFQARAEIAFAAAHPWEEAGLAVFQSQDQHATLALTVDAAGTPQVVLTVRQAGTSTRTAAAPLPPGEALLAVEADEAGYTFRARHPDADDWADLGTVERSFFSTERAGGFVGVHLGLYATGNGRPGTGRAIVRWFDYQPG